MKTIHEVTEWLRAREANRDQLAAGNSRNSDEPGPSNAETRRDEPTEPGTSGPPENPKKRSAEDSEAPGDKKRRLEGPQRHEENSDDSTQKNRPTPRMASVEEGRRQINNLVGRINETGENFNGQVWRQLRDRASSQRPSTSTQKTSRMKPSTSGIAENSRKRGMQDSGDLEDKKRRLEGPHEEDSDDSTQKDSSPDVGTPKEDQMEEAGLAGMYNYGSLISSIKRQALGGPLALGIDQGLAQSTGLPHNTLPEFGSLFNSMGAQARPSEGENLKDPASEDEMEEAEPPKLVRYNQYEPLSINISPYWGQAGLLEASPGQRFQAVMQRFLENPLPYLKNQNTFNEICEILEKREAEMDRNGETCPSTPRLSASPARHRKTPEQVKRLLKYFDKKPNPKKRDREELAARLNLSPEAVKYWFARERQKNAIRDAALSPDMNLSEDDKREVNEFLKRSSI